MNKVKLYIDTEVYLWWETIKRVCIVLGLMYLLKAGATVIVTEQPIKLDQSVEGKPE